VVKRTFIDNTAGFGAEMTLGAGEIAALSA
jgi:hypothetical protein